MATVAPADSAYVPPAEIEDVDLYHPKSWVTKYVFCQDAKVIAIQYSITAVSIGMIGLVMSWLMRLQLGFPDSFSFISETAYYQLITMHGMIMVIYLLTALFLGGFGNYLIPLMLGARDMVFPYLNIAELLGLFGCGGLCSSQASSYQVDRQGPAGRSTRRKPSSKALPVQAPALC